MTSLETNVKYELYKNETLKIKPRRKLFKNLKKCAKKHCKLNQSALK